VFRAGFRRQSRYRAGLAVGVAANVFFGIIRTALFVALYRQRAVAGGLTLADSLTYVWVIQTVFGVVFVSWIWEFADSVRSGDFVVDLIRPGDVLGRLLALDLGRSVFSLVTRGLPQLLVASLVLDLRLPTTVTGVAGLAVSFGLCAAVAAELRFLFGSMAFWTPDYRGWWTFLFSIIWLGGGFLVPVEFLPDAARWIAGHSPLAALLTMPVRVATGRGVAGALAIQMAWAAAAYLLCRWVMANAERRLVVHGG
jgi:ABC-2 type transport system permease protein